MTHTGRLAAAARHFTLIVRTRGVGEALARVLRAGQRRIARKLGRVARAYERRTVRWSRGEAVAEYNAGRAKIRVVVHAPSGNDQELRLTLQAIARLRRRSAPFSHETIYGGTARDALAGVSNAAREDLIAYFPAGIIPLSGYLEAAAAAVSGLGVDAVAANFAEDDGAARRVAMIPLAGMMQIRSSITPRRLAFAPEARVVDLRSAIHRRRYEALPSRRRVAIVDANIPMPDRDGGSVRMREILTILAHDHDVTFISGEGRWIESYGRSLLRSGIDVVTDREQVPKTFAESTVIWIARPSCAAKYLPLACKVSNARIIYDTVDLHHVRERRAGNISWEATKATEVMAIRAADATVVTSPVERAVAIELGARETWIVPTIHRVVQNVPGFSERSGLLFIGGFDHRPNVDAVEFLVHEIMPYIRRLLPGVSLSIVGSNPTAEVRRLQQKDVRVYGSVPDVSPELRRRRLSLAPLRFGAGIKAKVAEALAFGLPVVATTVAAEGFEGISLRAIAVADNAENFARAAAEIYNDEERWKVASQAALDAAAVLAPTAIAPAILGAAGAVEVRCRPERMGER